MAFRWPLSALLLWILVGVSAATSCYFPNGDLSEDDVPCTDDTASACCGPNGICLDDGLCLSVEQPYTLSRGSCTDETWESNNCPSKCKTVNPSGGCSIILFNNTGDSIQYCCNSIVSDNNQPACSSGDPFVVSDGKMIVGKAALANLVSNTSSTTSTGSTATSTSTTCPTSSASSSNTVAVGAGVGVSLGVVSIAAIAWALWERRQRSKASAIPLNNYYQSREPTQQYKAPVNATGFQANNQPVSHEAPGDNYQRVAHELS